MVFYIDYVQYIRFSKNPKVGDSGTYAEGVRFAVALQNEEMDEILIIMQINFLVFSFPK